MTDMRVCMNCGGDIIKKEKENNFRYKQRKFCTDTCYHEYYKNNHLGWYRGFNKKPEDL
jgi:uncharacterized protein with PIN domain